MTASKCQRPRKKKKHDKTNKNTLASILCRGSDMKKKNKQNKSKANQYNNAEARCCQITQGSDKRLRFPR